MNRIRIDGHTPKAQQVEDVLIPEFPGSEAYEYNSASIRVRVIDPRFVGKSIEERDAMVAPLLDRLPDDLQAQIMLLLTLTPEEAAPGVFHRRSLINLEFEDPSPSLL